MQSDEQIDLDLATGETREDLLMREIYAAEDKYAHQPLRVPEPPTGIAEFALARFLFSDVCYVRLAQSFHRHLLFLS